MHSSATAHISHNGDIRKDFGVKMHKKPANFRGFPAFLTALHFGFLYDILFPCKKQVFSAEIHLFFQDKPKEGTKL